MHNFGGIPQYEDFPDPSPSEDEVLIKVKAVALENVEKAMAEGTHFASQQFFSTLPAIVGINGIGELPNGQLAGFGGIKSPYGAMAEKVVVPKGNTLSIPEGIDAVIAASLPKPALTSLFPLKWGTRLQQGETVLINGSTGVAGKLAIQIAKHLGAGRIVATGRNEESLNQIKALGADTIIDLKQSKGLIEEEFRRETEKGIDVILDFLWGNVTQLLIHSLVPKEISFAKRRIRLVQIGEKAGTNISLSSGALRTTGLEIMGASSGITPKVLKEGTNQVWNWIQHDKLHLDIEKIALHDIEAAWKRDDFQGKRAVVII